ncbi:hypothetical protein [Pseudotabrizicola sp. 4114]|uniref:hypothetical protein n=1 Tax=Pseudotabrizicola sp. 4114 TaxID=2817731 RepID=UPI0032B7BE95
MQKQLSMMLHLSDELHLTSNPGPRVGHVAPSAKGLGSLRNDFDQWVKFYKGSGQRTDDDQKNLI